MIYNSQFNITPEHFRLQTPFKTQVVDKHGHGPNTFVVDQITGDCYLEDSEAVVRTKCLGILLLCPLFHSIATVVNLASICVNGPTRHDIVRIVSTPLVMVGLLFSALYGLFYSPYDGRKLYSTLERFYYHSSVVADCFQPSREDSYERVKFMNCCLV